MLLQGNVGSLLKAVDDEDDENAEESSNAGSNGADGRDSSVVGFLSILSLQQYPKATDVFRDAMLRIARYVSRSGEGTVAVL